VKRLADDGGSDDSDDVAGKPPASGEQPRGDIAVLRWKGRAQLEANSHRIDGASDMAHVGDRRLGNDSLDLAKRPLIKARGPAAGS
jgi:hypothetical protein